MASLYANVMEKAHTVGLQTLERYRKLGKFAKAAFWVWVFLHVFVVVSLVIVTPAGAFAQLASWAEGLREMQYGWLLLLGLIIVTSIPPLFGYGTSITLCGFAFGTTYGWLLGMTGCMLGSVVSFLLVRRLLSVFAPLHSQDKTSKALAKAVRAKGLFLVVLIRLCPFPFPYSNAFFASIESVGLVHFLIATLAITPKLFLHVWVGSRMYLFADPDERNKMDKNAKIVNVCYMFAASLLGIGTSWYLYRLTMQYVNEVALEEEEDLEEGLIRTIDGFLDSEPASDAEGERDESSSPMIVLGGPKRPSTGLHTYSAPPPDTKSSMDGRPSEDRWDGAFSDFDDPAEQDERDELGLGLATIAPPTRPTLGTQRSSSTLIDVDKRRD